MSYIEQRVEKLEKQVERLLYTLESLSSESVEEFMKKYRSIQDWRCHDF